MEINNLTNTEINILNSINDAVILERLQDDKSEFGMSIKECCTGIETAFKILGVCYGPLKEDLMEIFTSISEMNIELNRATNLIYSEWTGEIISQANIDSIVKSLE